MRFNDHDTWIENSLQNVTSYFKSGKNINAKMILEEGLYPVYGGNGIRGFTNTYNQDGKYILVGRQGALCGNVRLVEGKSYVTEHGIIIINNNQSTIEYLKPLLEHMHLEKESDQSAQPGLAVNKLLLLKQYFPSIENQERIGKLFTLLEMKIQLQNKIIEDLKLLKDSIIDYLYNHNGGLEYKFKDLYTKAKEGGTPSTTVTSYYKNGQIPFIKIDDLNSKYIIHNQTYITNEGMKNSSAWLIPINSVILSNGATIGVTSINTYPVTTKQGILGIIPSKLVNYEYLYYLLNTSVFKKNLKKITTKGTMECAYIKDIDNIILRVPTLDVQLKSVKILNSLDKRLAIENNMINEYKDQKIYLLRNLFI